jgi:hypothetical protein
MVSGSTEHKNCQWEMPRRLNAESAGFNGRASTKQQWEELCRRIVSEYGDKYSPAEVAQVATTLVDNRASCQLCSSYIVRVVKF